MKIAILGYSGSGKSTLARQLGQRYGAAVLHLDSVHHLPGWQERDLEEERAIVGAFLDGHTAWVIDGNYSKTLYERRLAEADCILLLLFGRFRALYRVAKRYRQYKGRVRPDMAPGCEEKLDGAFVRWVLWGGRSRAARQRYRRIERQYPGKVTVLRNPRQVEAFVRGLGPEQAAAADTI